MSELQAETRWRRMEAAPKEDYEMVLVLVRSPDGPLTHRLAMWDPENDSWTVFGANWDPELEYWMPLDPPPANEQN